MKRLYIMDSTITTLFKNIHKGVSPNLKEDKYNNMEIGNLNISRLNNLAPTEINKWEGKEENVLVLNYTLTCILNCDFCCYNCHPKRTEKMPLELAKRLIKEASELKTFSSVGFTGGEPLIYYQDIVELAELLKTNNLPFTIATSAFWATTLENAENIISTLCSLGLIRLNVSHDPSHAKFIPSINIINAAKIAEKYKLPIYIIGTFYSINESLEKMLPEISNLKYVKFVNKYVAKIGRAIKRQITQETYNLDLDIDSLCCYRRINHDIVVFFDGETYPCCSTFNLATEGILLGNANKASLRELWERAEGSIMLRVMKRQGFGKLYEIIKDYDYDLYLKLPKSIDAVGPCSICNKIFSSAELIARTKRVFEIYESEKIDNALSFMVKKFGVKRTLEIIKEEKI